MADPDIFNSMTIESRLAAPGRKWHRDPPDVIPLWLADPDFPMEPSIKKVLSKAVDEEDVLYGSSTQAMEAMAEKVRKKNGLDVTKDNIMVTQGVTPGMWLAIRHACREGDEVIVWGVDTLIGKKVEIAADLVVLATATVPADGAKDLAKRLKISADDYGFFQEVHPKLRPVESPTAGIYLAGAARAPMDIPESIMHASGAASKVLALFSQDDISHEPIVACVDEDYCSGCGVSNASRTTVTFGGDITNVASKTSIAARNRSRRLTLSSRARSASSRAQCGHWRRC